MTAHDIDWSLLAVGVPVLRMALVALLVVLVARVAEAIGPFLGGMIASLPIYTGPIYVLLGLEHDAAYMEQATIASVAICGATAVFILFYCALARRHGLLASLAGAYAGWLVCVAVILARPWSLPEALLFVAPIYATALPLARAFTRGIKPKAAPRRWYDLPMRAGLVAGLSGLVTSVSSYVPPQATGVLSVLPVILTSIVIVLHPRVGGAASAAVLAHTTGGLVGMILGFAVMHLSIGPRGVFPAMGFGLAVAVLWNLILILGRWVRVGRGP